MNEDYYEEDGPWDEPDYEELYEMINSAWHKSEICLSEDGSVATVFESTNDNLDNGYASEYASWSFQYESDERESALEKAVRHTGVTRQGIACTVTVTVNGQVLDQWPPPEPEEPEPAYLVSQRFINWLIVFAVIMVVIWTAFGAFVLPLFPHGVLRGSIALLGYASTFILAALLLIRYVRSDEKEKDEDQA